MGRNGDEPKVQRGSHSFPANYPTGLHSSTGLARLNSHPPTPDGMGQSGGQWSEGTDIRLTEVMIIDSDALSFARLRSLIELTSDVYGLGLSEEP